MMPWHRLCPTLIIALSIGSAIGYAVLAGDWRRATYWTAGAVLNFVVTY